MRTIIGNDETTNIKVIRSTQLEIGRLSFPSCEVLATALFLAAEEYTYECAVYRGKLSRPISINPSKLDEWSLDKSTVFSMTINHGDVVRLRYGPHSDDAVLFNTDALRFELWNFLSEEYSIPKYDHKIMSAPAITKHDVAYYALVPFQPGERLPYIMVSKNAIDMVCFSRSSLESDERGSIGPYCSHNVGMSLFSITPAGYESTMECRYRMADLRMENEVQFIENRNQ